MASHSFEYRATWPAAGARARPGHQLAGRKGCVSCRSCVSCMCAGHWPEEYFGLVCPLARTRARGDKPRAGTGHVPPAGVGSRPPPPEPGRVTSPQSPAWTSQRGCPPQLTARAEGGTECGAGPLHACGRPQPVRLRPVGPSRNPCHHQPIPKAWKGRNVKCEIKRPARAPGRAEGPAARRAPLSLLRRGPRRWMLASGSPPRRAYRRVVGRASACLPARRELDRDRAARRGALGAERTTMGAARGRRSVACA